MRPNPYGASRYLQAVAGMTPPTEAEVQQALSQACEIAAGTMSLPEALGLTPGVRVVSPSSLRPALRFRLVPHV